LETDHSYVPGGLATRRRATTEGGTLSKGKKFVALSLMTFIALIIIGAAWGHHSPGSTTGAVPDAVNVLPSTAKVPVSAVGINQLAVSTGQLGISINFTWVLMTGFL